MITTELILKLAGSLDVFDEASTPIYAAKTIGETWQAYVWTPKQRPVLAEAVGPTEASVRRGLFNALLAKLAFKQEMLFEKSPAVQEFEQRRSLIALARKRGKL